MYNILVLNASRYIDQVRSPLSAVLADRYVPLSRRKEAVLLFSFVSVPYSSLEQGRIILEQVSRPPKTRNKEAKQSQQAQNNKIFSKQSQESSLVTPGAVAATLGHSLSLLKC